MGNNSIKDIYEASIKAVAPITIDGTTYQKGDTILYFDSIQYLNLQSSTSSVNATGGQGNTNLVGWTVSNDNRGQLQTGTINLLGSALVNENKLHSGSPHLFNKTEKLITNNEGKAVLKYTPIGSISIFLINGNSLGQKIINYTVSTNTLTIENKNVEIFVDYWFNYSESFKVINIGERDLDGFLMFVGKFYYTDEYSGVHKTAIIEIPKIRVVDNFSIVLGRNVSPSISTLSFDIYAEEVGKKNTVNFYYLGEDIDGDL